MQSASCRALKELLSLSAKGHNCIAGRFSLKALSIKLMMLSKSTFCRNFPVHYINWVYKYAIYFMMFFKGNYYLYAGAKGHNIAGRFSLKALSFKLMMLSKSTFCSKFSSPLCSNATWQRHWCMVATNGPWGAHCLLLFTKLATRWFRFLNCCPISSF